MIGGVTGGDITIRSKLLYKEALDLGNDDLNIVMQDPQVHQHTLLDI